MVAPRSLLAIRVALLLLAGCAGDRAAVPTAAVVPAADGFGVIVAARPLPPGLGGAGDVRGLILASLGAAAPGSVVSPAAEFIVRAPDGQMLSVVQDNPQRLRIGERVAIRRLPRTTLLRAGTVLAAGG